MVNLRPVQKSIPKYRLEGEERGRNWSRLGDVVSVLLQDGHRVSSLKIFDSIHGPVFFGGRPWYGIFGFRGGACVAMCPEELSSEVGTGNVYILWDEAQAILDEHRLRVVTPVAA